MFQMTVNMHSKPLTTLWCLHIHTPKSPEKIHTNK